MKRRWLPRKAREKINQKKIAIERTEILTEMIKEKPEWAERYRELIRKIAKKYRIKLYKRGKSAMRKNSKKKGF